MKQTKIGAVLIGLMFLLSLVAAAVPAEANNLHMVNVVPNTGSDKADKIEIWDLTGKIATQNADPSTGGAWFSLLHGDYTAKVIKGGLVKDAISFTVNDTSTTTIIYDILTGTSVPAKPVLTAIADGANGAKLSWTYSGPAIDGYKLSRNGVETATIGKLDTSYADTGLTANTTYKYILTAYNIAGSNASDEVSITTAQSGTTGDMLVYDLNFNDEAAPGSVQTFELELKNNATYDTEDVVATIIIHNIANKDDLKTDIDYGAISVGDRQTESVDITIPQDADDKMYDITVDLAWKDGDGNHYAGTYTSTNQIEVVKVKHQISITSLQLDNAKYLPGNTVQVAVSLMDTGANAETVQLKASSDIGATATSASFNMKEGDSTMQYLSFNVPENAKAGKYYVVVTASYGSTYSTKSIVIEIASTEAPTTVAVVTDENGTQGGAGIPATEIALAVIIILLIGAIGWMAKDLIVAPKATAKPIAASRSKVFK